MTTKELEMCLWKALQTQGRYICFEVQLPRTPGVTRTEIVKLGSPRMEVVGTKLQPGKYSFEYVQKNEIEIQYDERVDALSYETSRIWRFFELKVSKSDFHSNAAVSFYGDFNYYVMPLELYEQIKDEIPAGIGVYVADSPSKPAWCKRKAKRQELKLDHDKLMFHFMQALSREYQKVMRKNVSKDLENTAHV